MRICIHLLCFLAAICGSLTPSEILADSAEKDALKALNIFLHARQSGALEQAWAMTTNEFQMQVPLVDFKKNQAELSLKLGPMIAFRVSRVIRYSENTSLAVDYLAQYTNDMYECGYFIWREVSGEMKLARVERNSFPLYLLQEQDASIALKALGCRPSQSSS